MYGENSSLFDSAGCSWCHLPELSLHQTANQRQESVWMSVNHFSKMGYNLSPLITVYGARHTLLTFTTQHANSLPPANSFVNCYVISQRGERVQIYHSWNEACCQISWRNRLRHKKIDSSPAFVFWDDGRTTGRAEPWQTLKYGRGSRNLQSGWKDTSESLIKPPNHVCKTERLLHVVNVLRMSSYKRGRYRRNFPKTNNHAACSHM